jgi:hypothetical protein
MSAMTRLKAVIVLAGAASFGSMDANAWWNDDDYYDRWYGGRWYGYPHYGWGGCPGYGRGGCPGYGWGGYPGNGGVKTIIVNPQVSDSTRQPEPRLPK